MEPQSNDAPAHFKGKDVLSHVVEAQAQGIISSSEIHGTETPGKIATAADAARDVSIALALLLLAMQALSVNIAQQLAILLGVGVALLVWRAGRSGWMGWSRLERLHRVVAQEKWEIDHHRQQERDELRVLYAAKGFEGKLLEEVLDVLMADGDRLLKVMVQEELGLSLQAYDHPLMQVLGAAVGALIAVGAFVAGWFIDPQWGGLVATLAIVAVAGMLTAYYNGNRLIAAVVWNVGIAILALITAISVFDLFKMSAHG